MTITLTREEAQQVLDALIWTTGSEDFSETGKARVGAIKVLFPAIETLRARLSAPEPEPVAFKIYKQTSPRLGIPDVKIDALPWVYDQDPSSGFVASMWVVPANSAPPQHKEWVELTDEEMADAWAQSKGDVLLRLKPFARAIETKLREKNGNL